MDSKLKFKRVEKLDWVNLGEEQKGYVASSEKVNTMVEQNPNKYLLYDVYQNDERIANVVLRFDDGSAFLWDFGIKEEIQRRGYGIQIINQLSSILADRGVKTLITTCVYKNKGALKFYRKVGFNVVSEEEFEKNGKMYHEYNLEKSL